MLKNIGTTIQIFFLIWISRSNFPLPKEREKILHYNNIRLVLAQCPQYKYKLFRYRLHMPLFCKIRSTYIIFFMPNSTGVSVPFLSSRDAAASWMIKQICKTRLWNATNRSNSRVFHVTVTLFNTSNVLSTCPN